jgi:TPR repeat protein
LYSIAYRLGSVRAANHLGILFRKGLGVEKDNSIAYRLFLESVSNPDTPDTEENLSYRGTAYYWLGFMAEHGEGVEQDLRAAKDWYKRGAACGQKLCIEAVSRIRPRSRPRH